MQLRVASLCLAGTILLAMGYREPVFAQTGTSPSTRPPGVSPTVPAPATKLEGFKPAAGTVATLGYDDLGRVGGFSGNVSVDVREMRAAEGAGVRGLVVEVTESEYRQERAFIDADEIPELLKGIDALLEVKSNPTQFRNFEVRYTTRGELQFTAFNTNESTVLFAVQAGRITHAQRTGLSASDMQKLRGLIEAAQAKLASLGAMK